MQRLDEDAVSFGKRYFGSVSCQLESELGSCTRRGGVQWILVTRSRACGGGKLIGCAPPEGEGEQRRSITRIPDTQLWDRAADRQLLALGLILPKLINPEVKHPLVCTL